MEPEEVERKDFLISLRGYDREQVDAFLRDVADELRRLSAGEAAAPPKASGASASEQYKEIGERTSKILMAAEDAAEEIRAEAKHEASAVLADARTQAAEILNEASADRQTAEEDIRRLREARSLLATQMEDVGRRLEETIARLRAPLDEAAGETAASPPRRKSGGQRRRPEVAAPEAKAETISAGVSVHVPVEEVSEVVEPALVDMGAGTDSVAELHTLLEEIRSEREAAKREVEAVLSEVSSGRAPAEVPSPSRVETRLKEGAPGTGAAEIAPAEEIDLRTQALGDLPSRAARRLKRALQEDQNVLLDRLRTHRGGGTFDGFLSSEEHLERFRKDLGTILEEAFLSGSSVGNGTRKPEAGRASVDLISKQVMVPLRKDLARVIEAGFEAKDTPGSIAERASDIYRVWKGVRAELLGEGLAYAAFHQGLIEAWREGEVSSKKWVVADEAQCPKNVCATNAASEPLALDSAFPSGHLAPPAHGGCLCTLAAHAG